MSFAATWMDPQIIILSEVSQTENDKYHVYVDSKKKQQMSLLTKLKQIHRHVKESFGYQKGRGEDIFGIWD